MASLYLCTTQTYEVEFETDLELSSPHCRSLRATLSMKCACPCMAMATALPGHLQPQWRSCSRVRREHWPCF
jgi:hypothetical protein